MSDDGLFPTNYREFLKKRDTVRGHNFEEIPAVSTVPPTVTFAEKLRWWSLDRWKRMKKIRRERDRRVEEIVQLKTSGIPPDPSRSPVR